MVVATWSVSKAVQRSNVVDFAVSTLCGTARFCAAKLCASFCSRTSESPNVFALPGSATRIGTPGTPALAGDYFITPMAATDFANPFGQSTRNAFSHKRR
jgi:hypothetical protein